LLDRPGLFPRGRGMAGTILITGTAGFIGFHAANRFLDAGW
jgi:nucleoside-diphosphate-sugar epimerase